ncbi:MAG TPA: hypothetical protein VNJ12_10645 [Candidatus Dormibacteraeota bacterium]|nr:hypothetical protein [Candidatus Dormibacteraeota bacterium]
MATKNGDSTEKTVRIYLFTKSPSGPVCVAKLVRNREDGDVLQREFDVLTGLHRRFEGGGLLPDSIPKPVGLIRVREEPVLLLAILPGASLERLLAAGSLLPFGQGKANACLERLRPWLEFFQWCTKGEPISEDMAARKFSLARIRAAWNGECGHRIARLGSACDELGTLRYVPVACHGRLSPRSVIAAGPGGNQIMDWDGYRESGHPLDDALDLVLATATLMSPWQAKKSARLFSEPKSFLRNALFSFIFPFRQSAGLSARQTYLYLLLRAVRWVDRAAGSRSERGSSLNLLRALVDEEDQIVEQFDGLAAA